MSMRDAHQASRQQDFTDQSLPCAPIRRHYVCVLLVRSRTLMTGHAIAEAVWLRRVNLSCSRSDGCDGRVQLWRMGCDLCDATASNITCSLEANGKVAPEPRRTGPNLTSLAAFCLLTSPAREGRAIALRDFSSATASHIWTSIIKPV